MKWSRGLLVLFCITLFFTVSIFLAPLTLAPGTFVYITGRANIVDHWDMYAGPAFNWYAKVIYTLGDAECHQLWYRSLYINGNQMPVDARDTSLFIFATFGLFWAMMTPAALTTSAGVVNAFPPRVQQWARRIGPVKFTFLVLFFGLLPVGLDGFYQLFQGVTHYESTNAVRVLTGVSGGLAVALVIGMMIKSIKVFNIAYKAARAAGRLRPADKE